MKHPIFILVLLLFVTGIASSQTVTYQTNSAKVVLTPEPPGYLYVNGLPVGYDGYTWLQGQIQNLQTNQSITVTNAVSLPAGSTPTVTNLGNGIVAVLQFGIPKGDPGNGTNYAAVIYSNSVLSSQEYTLYESNAFVFNGSNYLGSFPMLYEFSVIGPSLGPGGTSPYTNLFEQLIVSTNAGTSWFAVTNSPCNITNAILASVIGGSNTAPGAVYLYAVDHPELLGRTNAMFGQSFSFGPPQYGSDPVTLDYLRHYPVTALASNVVLDNVWNLYRNPSGGTNRLVFGAWGLHGLDLYALGQGRHIDSIALGSPNTNILIQIAQTNWVGAVLETTTNFTQPVYWVTVTNYSSVTNTGEITFTIPRNLGAPVQFWRAQGGGSVWLAAGPVTITASGLSQPFYTPTNSTDQTLGNVSGLLRWDTNYIYIGTQSNLWRRAALSSF